MTILKSHLKLLRNTFWDKGSVKVNPEMITGFHNYTPEIIYELRGLFAKEKIDSRPMIFNGVVLWLDAEQRLHRCTYPAVERSDGSKEFWEHGERK